MNPENGICLSALYDKAYDKGYIAITEKFEIILSPLLKKKHVEDYYAKYFSPLQNAKIMMPQKYYPKKEFSQFHLEVVFKG